MATGPWRYSIQPWPKMLDSGQSDCQLQLTEAIFLVVCDPSMNEL
jgi:hypothetical protein